MQIKIKYLGKEIRSTIFKIIVKREKNVFAKFWLKLTLVKKAWSEVTVVFTAVTERICWFQNYWVDEIFSYFSEMNRLSTTN